MNRKDILKSLINQCHDYPIIFTTGYTCREAYNISDRENHFYMVGSMGMVSSIGIGLAANINKPVIVVDGDGSLLMNPSSLFSAVDLNVKNLIHIVLDNGTYDSTGGQTTISNNFDFGSVSRSIGYTDSTTVHTKKNFEAALKNSLNKINGPTMLSVKISNEKSTPGERIEIPLTEIYKRFNKFLLNIDNKENNKC